MEQTILTDDQKKAIELFVESDIASEFYLAGGTALAEFYLQHRYSDDLDFFTENKEFPQLQVESLVKKIKEEIGATEITYRRLYDRRIFFLKKDNDVLKMEFSYYPFSHINNVSNKDGLRVDSLEDIASGKFMAMIDRIEPKDFVDLYFIFQETEVSLEKLLKLVEKKFEFKIDPVVLGSEFAKIKMVDKLPRMIKPLTMKELKGVFSEYAKMLKLEIFK